MVPPGFYRLTGACLLLAGLFTVAINLFLTPRMPAGRPPAEVSISALFLWRQGGSCVAVLLLLAGSMGLYLRQAGRVGRFGAVAFAIAWLGSAMTMAFEWAETFLLRTVALRAPQAVAAIDVGKGPSPYDLAAVIAAGIFAVGWLLLAFVTWRAAVLHRAAALAVIIGLFAIPLLQPLLHDMWGAVIGNVILGTGWTGLGVALARSADAAAVA